MTLRFCFLTLIAAMLMLAGTALAPTPANAQEGMSLRELQGQMQRVQGLRREEYRERLRQFQQRRTEQRQLRDATEAELNAARARSEELEAQFQQNELDLAALEELRNERLGAFGELFGVVRQVAGDTRAQFRNSLISAEYTERGEFLRNLAETQDLPEIDDLERLWNMLVENAIAQGEAVIFQADIRDGSGTAVPATVTRVGPFVALVDGEYSVWDEETQALGLLPRQPPARYASSASGYIQARDGFPAMAIDPSRGTLLGAVVDSPSLIERFQQGGTIGYITAGLAAIGVVLGLWLILARALDRMAIGSQRKKPEQPSKGNPLGRVLMAYEANKDADPETLELKLDDAIMRELPRLESGLNTVKVLAAVSPLLGLLGTVTGMILTFQAITLFGTGDPKMMAGGISQALVTTVIGLCGAIPLLLLHAIAYGLSRSSSDIIEGEAAGLIAQRAEREGKTVHAAA